MALKVVAGIPAFLEKARRLLPGKASIAFQQFSFYDWQNQKKEKSVMPRKKAPSVSVSSNSPVQSGTGTQIQNQAQSTIPIDVPVQVHNLGSPDGARMNFRRDEIWRRMNKPMGQKAMEVPVFLVNEQQMDTLYPPNYPKPVITEEVVSEALREYGQEDKMKIIEELLRKEKDKDYKSIVPAGLYVRDYRSHKTSLPQLGDSNFYTTNADAAFQSQDGPAIFLCCERIVKWANRLSVSHDLVMDKVYYHELGHAIMDTSLQGTLGSPYYDAWGRVVEESFANAIAYDCFSGKEALWVQRIMQDQPPEYRGYLAANEKLVFGDISRKGGFYTYYELEPHPPFHLLQSALRETFGRELSYEEFASLIRQSSLASMNIECWKRFKETCSDAQGVEVWKKFALTYLYVEGLKK